MLREEFDIGFSIYNIRLKRDNFPFAKVYKYISTVQ